MISDAQWTIYFEGRANGLSQRDAARLGGFSLSSAQAREKQHPDGAKYNRLAKRTRAMKDPIRPNKLNDEAKRALEDFDYFQLRYLGRIPIPWQRDAADQVLALLHSPDKEYVVINAPPGAGKSSLFTYAIPLWLTCHDRAIRGLIGSATAKLGAQYTANIRRALEATIPLEADEEDKLKNIAVDAVATLSEDFGRFKPVDHESWTKDAFIVQQYDGVGIRNKEPTWTAVGRDQEFIGGRYDFCIWDDLVTSNRLRTIEMIEKDRDWWDTYAERRLEPGGLLILQGQRMGAEDLYHYCLEMEGADSIDSGDEWDEEYEPEEIATNKYKRIIYQAHYEDKCSGPHLLKDGRVVYESHKADAPPYPEGCLLSPRRLTWRELAPIQKNKPETFHTVFQQKDVAPGEVLVEPSWVSGDRDHVGCWDKDRDRLEYPKGLVPPFYSIVSCDPSPTRYWAVEWWLYHPASEQHFLIDLERRGMDAPDFLDWNHNSQKFTGLMEEWQETSREIGIPISHWIVEVNAAQRFLLQYEHVKRWTMKNSVTIVPHTTSSKKSDPDYGVQMIAPHFRYGRIRLPGKGPDRHDCLGLGRLYAQKLVHEVTHYPSSMTDDTVMALWFYLFQLQHIAIAKPPEQSNPRRPSWLASRRALARAS